MCIDTKRELLCNFFILVCLGCPWQSKAFEVAERSEVGALESPPIRMPVAEIRDYEEITLSFYSGRARHSR